MCAFNGNPDRYTDYPYKDRNVNEAQFYSKVTVSSCVITSVETQNII